MRVLIEGIRIAWSALRANKLRTFLTLLGNIVGITSVIAVVSLLGGIDHYVRHEVAREGSATFTIRRFSFFDAVTNFDGFLKAIRFNPRLTEDDVADLRTRLNLASHVSGQVSSSARVTVFEKSISSITISGRDAEYPYVENIPLRAGRHISRIEDHNNAQVAVIGWEVYDRLFRPRDPVDRIIRIGNQHFRVIGVSDKRANILGNNRNRFVIIPVGAFRKLFGGGQSLDIKVRARDLRRMDEAIEEATVAMRVRHQLRPGKHNDFVVSTSEQLVNLWKKISSGIMTALVVLVGISMVVGGIVLMNTMLVSVTERTREIGIRKALGARRGAIVWQFLVESATLSVIGGTVGMQIGFLLAAIVSAFSVLPYVVNPNVVVVAFAVTILFGLVFGTYPAVRAARMNPVDALRAE